MHAFQRIWWKRFLALRTPRRRRARYSLTNRKRSLPLARHREKPLPDKGIHIAFGLFLAGLDRGEASCEQFRTVARFAPQDPEAYYELAKVLFQMKRFAEAAREADRAVTLDRSDYRIHYLLARIYTALGDSGKAEEHARHAVYVEQQ